MTKLTARAAKALDNYEAAYAKAAAAFAAKRGVKVTDPLFRAAQEAYLKAMRAGADDIDMAERRVKIDLRYVNSMGKRAQFNTLRAAEALGLTAPEGGD